MSNRVQNTNRLTHFHVRRRVRVVVEVAAEQSGAKQLDLIACLEFVRRRAYTVPDGLFEFAFLFYRSYVLLRFLALVLSSEYFSLKQKKTIEVKYRLRKKIDVFDSKAKNYIVECNRRFVKCRRDVESSYFKDITQRLGHNLKQLVLIGRDYANAIQFLHQINRPSVISITIKERTAKLQVLHKQSNNNL